MIPVFLLLAIGWALWIRFHSRRTDASYKETHEAFLQREHEANLSRKKDISTLDYIRVPLDTLPFPETDKEEISDLQKHIYNLAAQRIVNFTGLSNTDLKLRYGAANIQQLMAYDTNYLDLVRSLYRYGKYLYDNGYHDEARTILEYGLSIGSDVSANYTLLATIYKEENAKERIDFVISQAEQLTVMTKNTLLNNLMAIRDSAVGENQLID